MKRFQKHLDDLCASDDEVRRMDEAQVAGATVSGSDASNGTTGATLHEEVMMPFPGLQETPHHAV